MLKRLSLALLVLVSLALGAQVLLRDDPPAGVERPRAEADPTAAAPLPGYREDVAPPADPRRPARLQGRPPAEEPRDLLVRVVDPDGKPVGQAVVVVERGAGEDWREWVETLANGEVRVAGPHGDQTTHLDVREPADADGAPLALLPGRVEGVVPGQAEVTVELAWSRRLSGTVRTTEGDAVAGTTVRAGPPSRYSAGREATTDEEGRFEIVGLPPGSLEVRLKKNERWIAPALDPVAPDEEEIAIEVDLLVPFTVMVVDPRGVPVPGVLLSARWGVGGVGLQHSGETDEHGQVVLPAVPRSTEITVFTEWHLGAPQLPDVAMRSIPAESGGVTLGLPEPAAIAGTIVDPTGRPLGAGQVHVALLGDRRPPPGGATTEGGSRLAPVRDGAFCISRLHAGAYRLTLYANRQVGRLPPTVVTAPCEDLVLRLEVGVRLEGRVVGGDARGAIAQWFTSGEYLPDRTVKQDGTFSFDYLADSPGSLYVFDPRTGACALLEGVKPTDGPFRVERGESLDLAGRVAGYVDRPGALRLLCVRGPIARPVHVGPDGDFEVPALPPGTWRLEWRHGADVLGGIDARAGDRAVEGPFPEEIPEGLR